MAVQAGQQATLNRRLRKTVMVQIIEAMYRFCCDEFGPNVTDRIFAAAVEKAQATRSGRLYSPRNLL
jgi:hypothetical protein